MVLSQANKRRNIQVTSGQGGSAKEVVEAEGLVQLSVQHNCYH